jgi:hypothetical protein
MGNKWRLWAVTQAIDFITYFNHAYAEDCMEHASLWLLLLSVIIKYYIPFSKSISAQDHRNINEKWPLNLFVLVNL